MSQKLLHRAKHIRGVSFVLVSICFFMSMLVTNDVALITMVPFTIAAIDFVSERRIIFIIVMETIAANLGSMLTPIGNPQNLYLFSMFNIGLFEFLKITLPVTIVGFILISALTLSVPSQKINVIFDVEVKIENKKKLIVYLTIFCACILTVIGVLDYKISLVIALIGGVLASRKILRSVDYSLLLTFIFFFVFVGNMTEIESIEKIMGRLVEGREFLLSIGLSQGISNVPVAVMLSAFTKDYKSLLLGTNIGGLGTIIASLASLISYKIYCKKNDAEKGRYFTTFTVINIGFLIVIATFGFFL